jgi:type III pantothenate kinase
MNARIMAVDAGNTRIKWGVHDGERWLTNGAVDTTDLVDSCALQKVLEASAVDCIVISNVAGASVAQTIEDQVKLRGNPVTFISAQRQQCGVVNQYANAGQLGSDRWAALVAAKTAPSGTPQAQLVVMCGTALTVDALTADGHFLGGIIVPGIALMRNALSGGTAALPLAPGEYQIFPTNTANAITSGAVEACVGAVQRMYAHLSTYAGVAPDCIGSGGAMPMLAPRLPFPVSINDNLVLDGILAIAKSSHFKPS